jgi:LysR family transcriptional activator of nhaA
MRTLNYNHLFYFWSVARDGNLTRAAEALAVSQSALSVQIRKLEAQLGHDLFERRGRTLALTEAGRIALDYADAVFAAGEELSATLREHGAAQRRRVRVGAIATLSRNFQIDFLEPIASDPQVELRLVSATLRELLEQLEAHHLDVVLTNQIPARDADATWVPFLIAEQPVSLVGSPDLVPAGATLRDLLDSVPLILPTRESGIRAGFDALAVRLGAEPKVLAEVDDMAMLRLLARKRTGIAVVPPIVVKDELATGELAEVASLPGLHEDFYAITPERRFPNPLLARLLATTG